MNKTTEALKLAEEALLDCIEKFHAMQSTMILGVLPIQAARASQALAVIREARAGQDHIANASKAAVLAEREACAEVCDDMGKTMPDRDGEITEWCAAAIRARGEK